MFASAHIPNRERLRVHGSLILVLRPAAGQHTAPAIRPGLGGPAHGAGAGSGYPVPLAIRVLPWNSPWTRIWHTVRCERAVPGIPGALLPGPAWLLVGRVRTTRGLPHLLRSPFLSESRCWTGRARRSKCNCFAIGEARIALIRTYYNLTRYLMRYAAFWFARYSRECGRLLRRMLRWTF